MARSTPLLDSGNSFLVWRIELEELIVSAPGRICLFGEHQDFLGLPVIAVAIDLRIWIEGRRRSDSLLKIKMPDIGGFEEIDVDAPVKPTRPRDYLRSAIKVVREAGWDIRLGYNCQIHGNIPINAGVSSSSALTVAWVKWLIEANGGPPCSAEELARLAHRAEVVEFDEPGGMMDHFAAAIGGLVYVDCRPPFQARQLPALIEGLVLGDSLEKKQTLTVLSDSKRDVLEGVRLISKSCSNFDLHRTPLEEAEVNAREMPEHIWKKVRANLVNRDLTTQALELLERKFDPVKLGRLLTLHHEQLRDGLGVSTSKIDKMLETAIESGALGGKINGSGRGGCMFAYAPSREEMVAEVIEQAGGKAYRVKVDSGARVEAPAN